MADAAFWYAAAAKQLAPLLLAAERGGMSMAEVVRWTNTGDFDEPGSAAGAVAAKPAAAVALAACEARDPRILSSVATTLETVLAPFEDPVVAASTATTEIDLDALLAEGGTLYLCGPSHEQHRVQGLFAALVSRRWPRRSAASTTLAGPLDPPLLLVLDEAANIAPVRDLDTLASTGAGMGVQLVTVCQDLAQLTTRYGPERARTIANNHRAKLLLSGVSDLGHPGPGVRPGRRGGGPGGDHHPRPAGRATDSLERGGLSPAGADRRAAPDPARAKGCWSTATCRRSGSILRPWFGTAGCGPGSRRVAVSPLS